MTQATDQASRPGLTLGRGLEMFEQWLLLVDRMGAAYVDAHRKITLGLGGAKGGADPVAVAALYARRPSAGLLALNSRFVLACVDAQLRASTRLLDLAAGAQTRDRYPRLGQP